ncbi:MAG: DHA2 family efflux MFS transporter permease subunit [Chloroflexi bacterium]|nr:DHA2 family efflux MFS transporter permease subunit [Chloroflexota bacterium]
MEEQARVASGDVTGVRKGRLRLAVLALGLGLFMCLLDVTIVNISIPSMMKDLGADLSRISWVLDAYLIALAVLILTVGKLADQLGRRRVYYLGIAIFMLGSLLCAISWNASALIAFRVMQAIGGATLIPVTMAMMTAMFPPEKRGLSLGIWGAIGVTAAAVGPSLGGVLVEYLSWRWIFYVNLPIGAAALLLTAAAVSETKDPAASRRFDLWGMIAFSISVFSLVFAVIQGEAWGWGSASIVGLFVTAAVFLGIFITVERLQREPMLDLGLFRVRDFSASGTGQFLAAFGMAATLFLLTVFLQNVLGYSALKAAVAITPIPGTILVFSPLGGRLCDRLGARPPAVLGAILAAVGIWLLSQLDAGAQWGAVAWRASIAGAGFGLSNSSIAAAAMGAAPKGKEGVGAGFLNMSRMIGMAMGVAICVAIFTSAVATNVAEARTEVIAVIEEDQEIPLAVRQAITDGIRQSSGEVSMQSAPDIVAMAKEKGAPAAVLEHLADVQSRIVSIVRSHIADAFSGVVVVAAAVSAIGLIPVILIRRRGVPQGTAVSPAAT